MLVFVLNLMVYLSQSQLCMSFWSKSLSEEISGRQLNLAVRYSITSCCCLKLANVIGVCPKLFFIFGSAVSSSI